VLPFKISPEIAEQEQEESSEDNPDKEYMDVPSSGEGTNPEEEGQPERLDTFEDFVYRKNTMVNGREDSGLQSRKETMLKQK